LNYVIISLHLITLTAFIGYIAYDVIKSKKSDPAKKAKVKYKLTYRNPVGNITTLECEGFSYMEGGPSPASWVKIRLITGDQDDLDDFLDSFSDPLDPRDLLVASSTGKRLVIQQPQIALADAWNDLSTGTVVLRDLHLIFFMEIVTAIDDSFEVPL
jgi:hypothetical protein